MKKAQNMKRVICGAMAASLLWGSAPFAKAALKYSDVPETHWAYESIRQTTEWGWVNGTAAGRFEPDARVTGAQFTVMMIRAFLPDRLNDMAGDYWYSAYSNAAKELGLLRDTAMESDEKAFDAPVNRYEMAKMVYNYLGGVLKKDLQAIAEENVMQAVADWDVIPESYREPVKMSYALGLLTGVDKKGTFSGHGTVTRAQAASVLCRLDAYLSDSEEAQPGAVGTFSAKPVTLSYDTHSPATDFWSAAPENIQKLTDKDAYNAAVQTIRDQSRIRRAEGNRNGYTQYYNYAVYRRSAKLKETNVTGAMSRLGGGGLGFVPRAVKGKDETLGFFGADASAETEKAMKGILTKMPSGSDKEKAEYLTKSICERFKITGSGAFTWTSLGTSGTGNSFSNAAAALFTEAGIPYICASGKSESGSRFWGYTFLDGTWFVTDAASQAKSGSDQSHISLESFLGDDAKSLDTFTSIAMALTESADV